MNILNSGRFSMGSSSAGMIKKLIGKAAAAAAVESLPFVCFSFRLLTLNVLCATWCRADLGIRCNSEAVHQKPGRVWDDSGKWTVNSHQCVKYRVASGGQTPPPLSPFP